jgi:peptidoglycan/LPS O-acetylase OafA/YrhL
VPLEAAAIAIFAMAYLVVAVQRLPGFRLDRAGAAPVGASLMVAAAARPVGGIARPALDKPPAPVARSLFPLFYLVEIRHRQLLRSRSRTR